MLMRPLGRIDAGVCDRPKLMVFRLVHDYLGLSVTGLALHAPPGSGSAFFDAKEFCGLFVAQLLNKLGK